MSGLSRSPQPVAQLDQKLTTSQAAVYASTTVAYLEELRLRNKGPVFTLDDNGEPQYRPDSLNSWIEYGKSDAA